MFVKVGDNFWWFLMKDVFVVKLDFIYYFFIIYVFCFVDEMDKEIVDGVGGEVLSYGVIFLVIG